MLPKPADIIDREDEWNVLSMFVRDRRHIDHGASLIALSGRRRTGKSHLLERFTALTEGIYFEAFLEEELVQSQERFRNVIIDYDPARRGEVSAIPLGEGGSWDRLLQVAMDATVARSSEGRIPPVVLDEFPYLLRDTPHLQSILKSIYDSRHFKPGETAPPGIMVGYYKRLVQGKLIVCGSAMSIMHELGHGSRPLFGRISRTLTVAPFNHIDMARYWGVDDLVTAMKLYAVLGGSPGYRNALGELTELPPPQDTAQFDAWVMATMLTSSDDFFTAAEARHLLREDPRAGGKIIYQQAMKAIADGATTATQVGGVLGETKKTVEPVVDRLIAMGYVDERRPLFEVGDPMLRLRDPLLRFHHAVVEPDMDVLRLGEISPQQIWTRATPRFGSQVLGPAFEEAAAESAFRILIRRGVDISRQGWTCVSDRESGKKHEVDFIGLGRDSRTGRRGATITVIGEAKATIRPRGLKDLERLRHIRSLLAAHHQAADAKLLIVSMYGFSDHLHEAAASSDEVVLLDLADVYGWG
ncbi:ATPase AAA [Acrocarpospora phusangensis]|uniref:ATPase AAA n=1 Tax=Acrocarpospora phusangensis TaxID=1070424 RepID=A0A919QAE6_9ACTN|nr:hypothetical protein [Acrocarpospora phusangensis]GIH23065.1 ATPase AAA [Acrocarpospora phusangensis]